MESKESGCSKNILKKYVDTLEYLDIGVFTLNSKGYIIEQNPISEKWFGNVINILYQEFCILKLKGVCSADKDVVSLENSKRYKVDSIKLELDGKSYTVILFKEEKADYINVTTPRFGENIPIEKNFYLLNRTAFIKNMKHIIYEADIIHSKVSLLFIEVVNLHKIVDTYNKSNGDKVMNIIAKRLRNSLRESDLIGRFDNSRFAVAIRGIDGIDIPKKISKKILHNISRPIIIDDKSKIDIDISIGISIYPDDSKDIDELVSQADLSKYRIKIKTRRWLMSFIA